MDTNVPKTRLGKRTPMGKLVSTRRRSAESMEQQDAERVEGSGQVGRDELQSSDQIKLPRSQLLDTELPCAAPPSCPPSSSADVPSSGPMDFDEMSAAMALVSLSCEPVVIISAQGHPATAASWEAECGVVELSGGNKESWALDHSYGMSTPSSTRVTDKGLASPNSKDLGANQGIAAPTNLKIKRNGKKKKSNPGSSDQHTVTGEHGQQQGHVTVQAATVGHREQDSQNPKLSPPSDLPAPSGASSVPQSCTKSPNQVCAQCSKPLTDHDYSMKQPSSFSATNPSCSPKEHDRKHKVKKCRKVYGVNQQDVWCTSCRWKKACKRFPR